MTNYRVVSWTPKGEMPEVIHGYCNHTDGFGFDIHPQDLIRTALYEAGILIKEQPGAMDWCQWRQGLPIKTSLWNENHLALTQFAKEQGMNKQQLIQEVVLDYINANPHSTAN
mgnify:CR=1 FL=1